MANELQSLSQLFQNRLFRIPDYQRGYAWQQSQLVDFWDDLINLQPDRYHYTGLLSLKSLSRKETTSWGSDLWMIEKGFKPCHIVDGQQRLTTFIILLNEIVCFVRRLEENVGKNDEEIVLGYDTLKDVVAKYIFQKRPPNNVVTTFLFGYEIDNPSEEYLKYKIFNEPCAGTVNETYYTKNLKFAKTFFLDNIFAYYESEGIDGISDLYRKLTLKLMFNIHEIDDDYDVFIAFETMNNRGKKLTNLELLKNRLIYLTTLYSVDKFDDADKAELRKQINDAWKEVYYQLGRNKTTPLSDDDFLRAHWIMYFAYSRKKGDDYIRFLLRKFSAKSIFEKKTILLEDAPQDIRSDEELDVEDDNADDAIEQEFVTISKLEPTEIKDYVNSLKDMAKYWYDTFFPYESQNLTDEEKVWIDRLNRIGIGYFRPLITAIISKTDTISVKIRISVFKAIERFIFICFRMGNFNATFCSSEYYRAARSIYLNEMPIINLIADINETVDLNMEYAIPNFVTKIEKRFSAGDGYYGWNSLKYFMYEYEYSLATKNGIKKITWELFSRVEKDKVSIEHILPQTPTKFYWQNQFRQFTTDEIKLLSGALGNLLPLSQSVNSSLQNDSFDDKKLSQSNGRRGYENGSHSEIEVSKETEWNADKIYERSLHLLHFLTVRWNCSLSEEQKEKLVYVTFVNDGRVIPDELGEDGIGEDTSEAASDLSGFQEKFWKHFVDDCVSKGKEHDIASRKPAAQNWYDITVGAQDFHVSFTVTRNKYISILLYVYDGNAFERLESKKVAIETAFGDSLDWYSSRKNSVAKRIIYKKEADIFNDNNEKEIFDWMIDAFDNLKNALVLVGEII